MNSNQFVKTALSAALTLGMASLASTAMAQQSMSHESMQKMNKQQPMAMKKGDTVKCYGINAAHKNDCQSPGHSCAWLDSKVRDSSAYVEVAAGLCTKIAGGSLTAA